VRAGWIAEPQSEGAVVVVAIQGACSPGLIGSATMVVTPQGRHASHHCIGGRFAQEARAIVTSA
jgi:hypothetical protein